MWVPDCPCRRGHRTLLSAWTMPRPRQHPPQLQSTSAMATKPSSQPERCHIMRQHPPPSWQAWSVLPHVSIPNTTYKCHVTRVDLKPTAVEATHVNLEHSPPTLTNTTLASMTMPHSSNDGSRDGAADNKSGQAAGVSFNNDHQGKGTGRSLYFLFAPTHHCHRSTWRWPYMPWLVDQDLTGSSGITISTMGHCMHPQIPHKYCS